MGVHVVTSKTSLTLQLFGASSVSYAVTSFLCTNRVLMHLTCLEIPNRQGVVTYRDCVGSNFSLGTCRATFIIYSYCTSVITQHHHRRVSLS